MSTAYGKEPFLADHKWLEDAVLLAPPPRGPFTRLTLFVCTYVAKLSNLHTPFETILDRANPVHIEARGPVLVINSNFGHVAQPGYEHLIKHPKPRPPRLGPTRGRERKVQGDGTCFNSAIEPIVEIDHPGLKDDKLYFVKCFTTTGETQVPGVVSPDLSDGHAVLAAFVDYLNAFPVGDPAPGAPEGAAPADVPRLPITILSEQPKMINYKYRLVRNSPRILVNLRAFGAYMQTLETTKAVDRVTLTDAQMNRFYGWPGVLLPPFTVRETKPPTDDVKVSFRFKDGERGPRVNVFQEGKINILGAASVESAERIYDFFVRLFTANWSMLVCLQPRRDLDRRQSLRAPRPPVPAPRPPPPRLSDEEVDAILADVLGPGYGAYAPAPIGADGTGVLSDLLASGAPGLPYGAPHITGALGQGYHAFLAPELRQSLRSTEGEARGEKEDDPAPREVPSALVGDIVSDLAAWGFEDEDVDDEDADGSASGGDDGEEDA